MCSRSEAPEPDLVFVKQFILASGDWPTPAYVPKEGGEIPGDPGRKESEARPMVF